MDLLNPPVRALILGAGRGKRMRPLSDRTPKPLLRYHGKRLIDWQIEAMARGGVRHFVVNTAHLADQFPAALGDGSDRGLMIEYSREGDTEADALETLGGIARALPLLSPDGQTPFIVAAGDIVTDFDYGALAARAGKLARGEADAHLVLVDNPSFHPQGDMALTAGLVRRTPRQYTFASIGLYSPRIFRDVEIRPCKLFPWLYRFCDQGRVTGEVFRGLWKNIGTPQQLED
ncbi:nucleotidyltransferase family protein [Mesosutterella faecium]|uniref:nucleotidyltransferase family protein n=1 Tax=Mesosutterella faecium TaxID=2925194 RepID=UPI0030EE586D